MAEPQAETYQTTQGSDDASLQAAAVTGEQDLPSREPAGEHDVLLDVPSLSVDEIKLEVEHLHVHVALDARLANLLVLSAGANAHLDNVNLSLQGVKAQVQLKVRLNTLAGIIDRTLKTIDRNPRLLERLLRGVEPTPNLEGEEDITPDGLLSQRVNALGQTVQRLVDHSGHIVERTLDADGAILTEQLTGSVMDLKILDETEDDEGLTVRRLRDPSGAELELTLDRDSRAGRIRIISQVGVEE